MQHHFLVMSSCQHVLIHHIFSLLFPASPLLTLPNTIPCSPWHPINLKKASTYSLPHLIHLTSLTLSFARHPNGNIALQKYSCRYLNGITQTSLSPCYSVFYHRCLIEAHVGTTRPESIVYTYFLGQEDYFCMQRKLQGATLVWLQLSRKKGGDANNWCYSEVRVPGKRTGKE